MLTLDKANALIVTALQEGARLGIAPKLAVAVLDAGGHLRALVRQDQASSMRGTIAIAKASGALALGVSSRRIAEMAIERPTFIASLAPISPAGIVPAAGGMLVIDDHGNVVGAVGISGDTSDNDEACALAGIAAVGFHAGG